MKLNLFCRERIILMAIKDKKYKKKMYLPQMMLIMSSQRKLKAFKLCQGFQKREQT